MLRRRAAVGCGVVALLALATLWYLRPKQPPYREQSEWRMDVGAGTPTGGGPGEACSLRGPAVLTMHRRLVRAKAESAESSCMYVFHLPDWPDGEDECVLEYQSGSASAIVPSTIGARLAETYYRRRQGGMMYFTSEHRERVFVSLDARWCRWSSVTSGLHVAR